jgi:hypothetical protein
MSKLKLKNILSELLKEMGETHPVHKDINDKLLQIAKRGSEDEKEEKEEIKEGEDQEYTVDYWYRYGKDGDDKDMDDIKVKASSEAEAIEKAKQGARKGAMSSSFEIRKKK